MAVTLSKRCDVPRALMSVASNFSCDETKQEIRHSPYNVNSLCS